MVGYDPQSGQILPWEKTLNAPNHKVFVHNIILLDDSDYRHKPYNVCRNHLRELFNVNSQKTIVCVDDEYVTTYDRFVELYNFWNKHRDTEGVVLKKYDGIYQSGKRTKDQSKLKKRISIDCLILGYKKSAKGVPTFMVGVWNTEKSKIIPIGGVEG